jgi:hypothetical protein
MLISAVIFFFFNILLISTVKIFSSKLCWFRLGTFFKVSMWQRTWRERPTRTGPGKWSHLLLLHSTSVRHHFVLFCFVLIGFCSTPLCYTYTTLSYSALSYSALSNTIFYYSALSYSALSYSALSYSALSYSALSYSALSTSALSSSALFFQTIFASWKGLPFFACQNMHICHYFYNNFC